MAQGFAKLLATESTLSSILTSVQTLDNFISGSRGLVTEDNSASILTALQTIDNFISGSRGLVTEDNSASILSSLQTLDNFISGSRGLVTEDNSASILTSLQLLDDAVYTDGSGTPSKGILAMGTDGTNPQAIKTDTSGELQVDVLTMPTTTVQATNLDIRDLASGTDSVSAVQSGTWNINNISGTISLPTGASTLAEQQTQTTALQLIDNIVHTEDEASADGHSGVPFLAVRKATPANTSGTDGDYEFVQMSAGRLWTSAVIDTALPAGTNAIGKLAANSGVDIGDVDVTSLIPGSGATNLGKAEDAVHGDGDVGVMMLSVRKNTAASTSGSDGDYQPLITDTNGRLHVLDQNSASALTALQLIDDTVVSPGTALGSTKVSLMGGSVTTAAPSYTTGQVNALSLDTAGNLRVNSEADNPAATADGMANPTTSTTRIIPMLFNGSTYDRNRSFSSVSTSLGYGSPRMAALGWAQIDGDDGKTYAIHTDAVTVNAGATSNILVLKTSATKKMILDQLIFTGVSTVSLLWNVYLTPTVSGAGTGVTPVNIRQGGSAATVVAEKTPTTSANGSLVYSAMTNSSDPSFALNLPTLAPLYTAPSETATYRVLVKCTNAGASNSTVYCQATVREN